MLRKTKSYFYVRTGTFPHSLVKVFHTFGAVNAYVSSLSSEEREHLEISSTSFYSFVTEESADE